jgi:undecaprenyl-diphosphatase
VSAIEAIVLGIVQGLTEFLPISSTGHLRLVPAFLGWDDPGALFTAVIQLGTMIAVLIYFRQDLLRITRVWLESFRRPILRKELDARMGWYIVVGTVPICIFGFAFRNQIEDGARNLYLIGTALIVLGLVLLWAEKVSTRQRTVEQVNLRDGLTVGFAQALALVPGVSRSGATITAGLFLGMRRDAAARFSFLLSVPAIVLSGLYGLVGIISDTEGDETSLVALAISVVFAFISGYASIAFLLRYLANHSTMIFVVYRVALGILALILAAAGVIE